MDSEVSKKAAKRKQQRLRKKEKLLENSSKNIASQDIPHQDEEKMNKTPNLSKDQILAERQAKKSSKQNKTNKAEVSPASSKTEEPKPVVPIKEDKNKNPVPIVQSSVAEQPEDGQKSKEQIHAEREARRLSKLASKKKVDKPVEDKTVEPQQPLKPSSKAPLITNNSAELEAEMIQLKITDDGCTSDVKSKTLSKAERRAIQESQRAAKIKTLEEKKVEKAPTKKPLETVAKKTVQPVATSQKKLDSVEVVKPSVVHKVKLFKHLYSEKCNMKLDANNNIHPAIIKLGLQYATDYIVGSNARCYAFLNAVKILINDFITPPEKIFSRGLEAEIQPAIEYLQNCRPFAVSMTNALKHIKALISTETSNDSDQDKKRRLIEKIDTYASEQIETAAIAISLKVREKISSGDVILTYGCSSLIKRTLMEAWEESEQKFRVVVVDSRPDHEGQEMLKSLTMKGINCTYVLINSISFIMPEVTKVLLGAHALLANGYVMSRVGTAQIALVAQSCNVPVLVCCETHKFSERVQTDAFVFNELGDPNALVMNKNSRDSFNHLKDWESNPYLTPLNLRYDVTPPELVTAVVTEVAILPCTSVQVILRVKPAE